MSVLHPMILAAGLGALAIPVLVHLLRRRRKPIPWAAMRFLQEAVRKRRRRLRLEQLLLFLCRCALVALLAVAVARPVLGARPGSARPTTLVLAVDDSIGSALASPDGRAALDHAIDRARAALDALSPMGGDRAGLVTLGAPGNTPVWPPTGDLDSVRRALDRLRPTDSAPTFDGLREVAGQWRDAETEGSRLVLRVLTAWRGQDPARVVAAGAGNTAGALQGVDEALIDPPAPEARPNLGVASVVPSTHTVFGESAATLAPPTRLALTLVRSIADGELTAPFEVVALPGGSIAGRGEARFAPGQAEARAVVTLDEAAFTPGRGGRVAVEARLTPDANPRDDAARAVVTVRRELRVGVVARGPAPGEAAGVSPGAWTMAALAPDARAGVDAFTVDPASLGALPAASVDALVVLTPDRVGPEGWDRAREVLARGGLVVVAPDADARGVPTWAPALADLTGGAIAVAPAGVQDRASRLGARVEASSTLGGLAGEFGELARSVGVRRVLELEAAEGAAVALTAEDATPLLVEAPGRGAGPEGRGLVAVLAVAPHLDWTDLPARPAFVPILQELVRRGSNRGVDAATLAGRTPSPEGFDRWAFDADLSGRPAQGVAPDAWAGVWLGLGPDGSVRRSQAVNPDARAAVTTPTDADAVRAAMTALLPGATVRFEGGTDQGRAAEGRPGVRATPAGDRLALLLLALAAGLAVVEAVLARGASHPEGGGA